MNRIKVFIKDELTGWKKWQIFWMIFANAIIMFVKWLKESKQQEGELNG